MAVAQGTCPSCGAPIEFGVGSSIAKVCEYCSATVLRSDRGLENLGKVAEIANTPSLIAVGDEGTLAGSFEVMVDNGARLMLGHAQIQHPAYQDDPRMEYTIDGVTELLTMISGHPDVLRPAPALRASRWCPMESAASGPRSWVWMPTRRRAGRRCRR